MRRWQRIALGLAIALGALVLLGPRVFGAWYQAQARDPAFFADEIAAFTEQDRASPPPSAPIVFVGSSSIRMWKTLAADMAPLPVLNRGFGGSHLTHVVHYADETIVRYAPRAVVVYGGDNDLDASTGKTAEEVARDFERLSQLVLARLPETQLYFLSIKPSKLRWERWPEMRRANSLIAERCGQDPRLAFVDVATPLLTPDGKPRDDVFLFDGLHLNETGYAEWTRIVRARLCADLGGC